MILGKHTIEEAREFAKLIEFRVKAEDNMLALKQPLNKDDRTVAAVARYVAWRTKWKDVSSKAESEMTLLNTAQPLVPQSVIVAEKQYTAMRFAVNKSGDDSFTDPGDMKNVMEALDAAVNAKPDLSGFRKEFPEVPTSVDADAAIFHASDTVIKTGEAAAAAANKAKDSVLSSIPWYVWVGGAGIAAVYAAPFVLPVIAPAIAARRAANGE